MSDLIDRQDAIKAVQYGALSSATLFGRSDAGMTALRETVRAIKQLPSAQPQRIKGRWIHDGYDIPHGVDWMHCSVCGRREPHVPAAMTNFCPTCGSDMRGEQDG